MNINITSIAGRYNSTLTKKIVREISEENKRNKQPPQQDNKRRSQDTETQDPPLESEPQKDDEHHGVDIRV